MASLANPQRGLAGIFAVDQLLGDFADLVDAAISTTRHRSAMSAPRIE